MIASSVGLTFITLIANCVLWYELMKNNCERYNILKTPSSISSVFPCSTTLSKPISTEVSLLLEDKTDESFPTFHQIRIKLEKFVGYSKDFYYDIVYPPDGKSLIEMSKSYHVWHRCIQIIANMCANSLLHLSVEE